MLPDIAQYVPPAVQTAVLMWVRYIKYIYISTLFIIVCLRSITIGTSRQSQLACHIRVHLQNTEKARIASPDGARGSRGALIADAHAVKRRSA